MLSEHWQPERLRPVDDDPEDPVPPGQVADRRALLRVRPWVTNSRSRRSGPEPSTPSAPYRAPTSSQAAVTMRSRARSSERSALMPTTASSSAAQPLLGVHHGPHPGQHLAQELVQPGARQRRQRGRRALVLLVQQMSTPLQPDGRPPGGLVGADEPADDG